MKSKRIFRLGQGSINFLLCIFAFIISILFLKIYDWLLPVDIPIPIDGMWNITTFYIHELPESSWWKSKIIFCLTIIFCIIILIYHCFLYIFFKEYYVDNYKFEEGEVVLRGWLSGPLYGILIGILWSDAGGWHPMEYGGYMHESTNIFYWLLIIFFGGSIGFLIGIPPSIIGMIFTWIIVFCINSIINFIKRQISSFKVAKESLNSKKIISNGNNINEKFCSNCGTKINITSKFCSNCGTKV